MKTRFEKEFKNEFNEQFKPTLDKELLKQELNIQVKENNTFTFKKKPFYTISTICCLLLVLLTSITTWAVAHYKYFQEEKNNTNNNTVDVVQLFKDKYQTTDVQLVSEIKTKDDVEVSLISIGIENVESIKVIFVVYCNNVSNTNSDVFSYKLTINDLSFYGKELITDHYIEYTVEYVYDYDIHFALNYWNDKIYEFYTKI